jgi:hypothetical protein
VKEHWQDAPEGAEGRESSMAQHNVRLAACLALLSLFSLESKADVPWSDSAERAPPVTVVDFLADYRVQDSDILVLDLPGVRKDSIESVLCGVHFLIRPDGAVSMGVYGRLHVGGLTAAQVEAKVGRHLRPYGIGIVHVTVMPYRRPK